MILRKHAYFWMVLLLLSMIEIGKGQTIGVPFVESYSTEQYGYGTQNWDIEQGETGLMYFANNEGLLEFDGSDWRLFPLPNKTILRSIMIKDGLIYGGGQNEFGIYQSDIRKKWRFTSLKKMIPESHQGFEDVWEIERIGEDIYFRASGKIFILNGQTCQVLDDVAIHFLGKAGERIFVQDKTGPLYVLEDKTLAVIPGSELLRNTEVRKVIPLQDDFLIATFKNGLFHYDGVSIQKWETPLENQFINTANLLKNGDMVIGTGFKGAIIIDSSGNFKYHVSTEDGLSNNRVISTFVDRYKNLWLGLDNGISMIRTNSPFSRIYPKGDLEGAGYDVAIFKDKIYFGTSSGLLYSDWNTQPVTNDLKLVQNSNGQVWSVDLIDDQLIMNHDEGAFFIKDAVASNFFNENGSWLFKKDQVNEGLIFSGNYNGISFFEQGSFQYLYNIPGLIESSRFIVQDKSNNYWMAHPYRGLYKITAPHDPAQRKVELLGPDQGLPSNLHNHVFKINGEVLVCAEKGVFTYDSERGVFLPYQPINQYLGTDVKVRRLFEGETGDVWFITEKEIGVLAIEEQGLNRTITKQVFPELMPLMNGGWEKIYPYKENHAFITTIYGFIHYNGNHQDENTPTFDIVLNEIAVRKDSIIYPSGAMDSFLFSPRQNSLLFNVAATDYVNNEAIQFQYFLKGFDEDWTPLSTLRVKEYTNLPPGVYTLNIRAVDAKGQSSSDYALDFEITKPWFATTPALFFYLLLALIGVYLLYTRSQKRYKALEQKVDSTVKQSKEEIQRLETEKIQAQLDHKKRELVAATLHLVQKNDTIVDIANQLSDIKEKSRDNDVKLQLQKLIRSLKNDEVMDEGWDQVMFHFNELHEDFFDRLKKAHPSLTPKDLRLCAYLKMNLTTKEMATLMNVSLRGVEASRYRLRKKMDLPSEENLTEFVMGY